jgi:uncharacterized membrane protein YfcA
MNDHLVIAVLGTFMGIVTSISGGAGVFAVPTMLALGFSPVNTLALNRMSDVGVIAGSLKNYKDSKSIDWKMAFMLMPVMALGSVIGANTVVRLEEEFLQKVILGGVIVGILLLLKPTPFINKGQTPSKAKVILAFSLLFLVGIWSGGLAMGGATFAVLVMVYTLNKDFLEARTTDLIAVIPETLISASILGFYATVDFSLFAVMFLGSTVGAWLGSKLAVKHGAKFIRKMMIGLAILMLIKVIVDL